MTQNTSNPSSDSLLADTIAPGVHEQLKYLQEGRGGTWYIFSRSRKVWLPEDRSGSTGIVMRHIEAATSAGTSANKVEAVKKLLRPLVAVRAEEFDADPWLLGVKNGVVDLRTGELRPAEPWLLMTRQAPVQFVEEATCPLWEAHLRRTLQDEGSMRFLQMFFGMAMVGEVRTHGFLLMHGHGRNGKGVIERVAIRVLGLGQYAATAGKELLVKSGRSKDYKLAAIRSARLVGIEEVAGEKLDTGLLKKLTGGDYIDSRNPYEREKTSPAVASFIIIGNELPDMSGDTSPGLWDRLWPMTAPGVRPLRGDEGYVADFEEVALPREYPGILNWALQGLRLWQEAGYQLDLTPEMEAFREDYRLREDSLQEWADATGLVFERDAVVAWAVLEQSLAWWWTSLQRPAHERPSPRKLQTWLRQRGCGPAGQPRVNGVKQRQWKGVRLLAQTADI